MSIFTKKELIKTAKQKFIIDILNDLIIKKGIDNIVMEDIAKAANYTKKSLYSFFKSKDEMLLEVYTKDLHVRWDYQKNQISKTDTGLAKLKIWAESLYEYCKENPQSLQIQNYMDYKFIDLNSVNQEVFKRFESINNELADGLREIFNMGINDGTFRQEIESDITISQFLYSYRAILKSAFSDTYSFQKSDQLYYVNHFIQLFTLSIIKQ